MVIDDTDPLAAKPDARLIRLLLRAPGSTRHSPRAKAFRLSHSPSGKGLADPISARLVRLSYLAPDITQAILDGRQPPDFTAEKLLEHSRLPLAWHDQRIALGFA